jgi:hypothetical protein
MNGGVNGVYDARIMACQGGIHLDERGVSKNGKDVDRSI